MKYNKELNTSKYNDNKIEALGRRYYAFNIDCIVYFDITLRDDMKEYSSFTSNEDSIGSMMELKKEDYIFSVYDMFDGKSFMEDVANNCISDYDGTLCNIFVDGYETNLGITHDNLTQGKFLLTEESFLNICELHHVMVNWANK